MADNRMHDGADGTASNRGSRMEGGLSSSRAAGPAQPSGQTGAPTATHRRNPAENLTRQDRVRGGEASASAQIRDQYGQFAGRAGSSRQTDGVRGRGDQPRQS